MCIRSEVLVPEALQFNSVYQMSSNLVALDYLVIDCIVVVVTINQSIQSINQSV